MIKLLLLSFLLSPFSFAQKRSQNIYIIYSHILNLKISDTTKSITIIKNLEIESRSDYLVYAIKNKDRSVIRRFSKELDTDSTSQQLIVDYNSHQKKKPLLKNDFNLTVQTFLVAGSYVENNFKKSIKQGWLNHYKEYPGSAGIMRFSKIYFSKDNTKGVFYYSHIYAGLGGGGSLVIMEKISDEWKVKYEIELWAA